MVKTSQKVERLNFRLSSKNHHVTPHSRPPNLSSCNDQAATLVNNSLRISRGELSPGVASSSFTFERQPELQVGQCIEKISFMLGVEATKDLEEIPVSGETSMGEFAGTEISTRVALAPVLRAGIGMTETLLTLLPDARVYHLGIFRDSNTDAPVQYYSMIRKNPPIDKVLLLDPMVGTGGTSCAAVKILLEVGVSESNIKLLCVLASREGIQRVQKEYPALEIHVSTIDDDLVQKGRHKLISPGFGDAGDRIFNTL